MGDAGQFTGHIPHPFEAIAGGFPIAHEHQFMVRAQFHRFRLAGDPFHHAGRIGECVVAKRQRRALKASLDL
mgnify:CR=1 FL=1